MRPPRAARAALQANPDATATEIAKLAKVSRSTVVNARADLRKPETKPPTERRQRAQRFLRDELARGPKRVTDVEEAAVKAGTDVNTLEQARGSWHRPEPQLGQHPRCAVGAASLGKLARVGQHGTGLIDAVSPALSIAFKVSGRKAASKPI